MSINKKALTRYMAYDKCLSNRGRKWAREDLMAEVNRALSDEGLIGIGKTQFYADINYMQFSGWQAPIEPFREGRRAYFRYTNPNYSINNQPINELEAQQLKSAVQVLSRIKGMPQFDWVNEMIPALEKKLGLITEKRETISFENDEDYEGRSFITPIFNAILNKRVLQISYQDFKSEQPYQIEFHPYYLKQFNSRWYALGYNPALKLQNWTVALDRIKAPLVELQTAYIYKEIDWEDYFSDFIGVSKNEGKPDDVRLLIMDEEQAAYIRTKPLHQTQKEIKKTELGFETSISVIPNYELEKLILSFGERIKVLSPQSLKDKITKRIREANAIYT